ncbi:hypothetical protein GCM10023149_15780 [Mucilaginibacter gynuensis]|uniref:NHL repeat-containing protein n=1 Tax=Mucilaginibacter gynuensis TaxID=1302236 RepID=A0ABP8G5Y8_9SPHI
MKRNIITLLFFILTIALSCKKVDKEIDRQNAGSGIVAFAPASVLLGDTITAFVKVGIKNAGASLKIGNADVRVLSVTAAKWEGRDVEAWKIIVPANAPLGEPSAELTVNGQRQPAFYGLQLNEPPALIEGKVTVSLFAGAYHEKQNNDCGFEIIYPAKDGTALQAQFGRTNLVACSKTGGIIYVVEYIESYGCSGTPETQTTLVRKIENGMVTTIAGGGTNPNGNGLAAKLPTVVRGFAVAPNGLLYLTVFEQNFENDGYRHRIISIDPSSGKIATVTGGQIKEGYYGYIKDGPAQYTEILDAGDMCFDREGNLYFLDMNGLCIRKLDVKGNVTTLFGALKSEIIENETYLMVDYQRYGHEDGFGKDEARFGTLSGIAIANNGKLYVTDNGGGPYGKCIREINPETNEVATIIGKPFNVSGKETGTFKEVSGQPIGISDAFVGMDVDFDGNLLVTSMYGVLAMKLYKVDLQFETVKLIAGGGYTPDPTKTVPGS